MDKDIDKIHLEWDKEISIIEECRILFFTNLDFEMKESLVCAQKRKEIVF